MGRTFDVSFRAIAPERLNSTARYDPELAFDAVQYPRPDVDSWTNVSVRMAPAPNFSAATAHFYSGITFGTPLPTPNPGPFASLTGGCGGGVAGASAAAWPHRPELRIDRLQTYKSLGFNLVSGSPRPDMWLHRWALLQKPLLGKPVD